MLDDLPKYTTEPDWMLQSVQISDSALICILVKTYYPGIYRFAASLLKQPEKSDQVSRETINWAVINRHRFWGLSSLRVWLYSHVYQACQRLNRFQRISGYFDKKGQPAAVERPSGGQSFAGTDVSLAQAYSRLGEKQRTLLLLECLDELTAEEIAQVLGGKERAAWIKQRLLGLHVLLLNRLGREEISELEIKARLGRLLQESQPERPLPIDETALCKEIETQITAGWQRRKFVIGGKELAIGGIVVALVIGLGLATNLLAPAPEATRSPGSMAATAAANNSVFVTPPSSAFGVFFLSTDFPSSEIYTPTPVTPQPQRQSLTAHSTLSDIQSRMSQSDYYWSTLYVEALILDYGPMGYVGPPQLYRNHLWFSRPAHMLVLAGRPNQHPDYARIVIDNNYFEEDMTTGVAYYPKSIDLINSPRSSSIILSYALNYSERNRLYGYYLTDLIFPYTAVSAASQIQFIGTDSFNGRDVLVLRWVRDNRKEQVWVDAITGLVLGSRTFEAVNSEVVAKDIFITSMAIDIDFPVGLYSYRPQVSDQASWSDVWTPTGSVIRLRTEEDILRSAIGRIPTQVVRAPAGLDPSNSRLTFQWQTLGDGSLSPNVNLLAGNYLIGMVNMGDPWSLLCTRSPDGGMIAFIKHPDIPIYAPDTIQWFRTQDASKVYDLFPNGYTASDVAFSPDSKYLAFFGCTNYESNCGVFLLNTQTQEQRKLKSIGTAAYFTWSPDGQSLALLGSDDLGSLRVFIIKIDTGEVTYTGPVDWKSFATAPDSPTRNWGVPFPGSMGGLEACVTRPIP